MKKEYFYGEDSIHTVQWSIENPKGVVQIVHGMLEYIENYDEFAKFLNKNGYVVVGNDHSGHGKTAKTFDDLGVFPDKYDKLVEDMNKLQELTKEKYKDKPYIVIGHSMGSFITRAYLSKYSNNIDKAVIMGTGQMEFYQSLAAVVLGKIVKIFKGGNYRSKFLNLFTTERLNKMLGSNTKTKGDWLSRDEKEVEKALNDEYRQFIPTVNMSLGIFELTNYVRKRENIKKIRKDLPILLISGGQDPLGNFGKGIEKLDGIMKSEGLNTTVIIYDGSRHELLHELNKEEVMNDILKWIESK